MALRQAFTLVLADRVAPTPWRNGGGCTRELFVWPDAAHWALRISLADITQDGPFSAFPGVQRHFAVLAGAGVRLGFAQGERCLTPQSPPCVFDGALAPHCRLVDGPTCDLRACPQTAERRLASRFGRAGKAQHRSHARWHGEDLQRRSTPEAAAAPTSAVCGQALNLMLREGQAGALRALADGPGHWPWRALFCAGAARLHLAAGQTLALAPRSLLLHLPAGVHHVQREDDAPAFWIGAQLAPAST